VIVGRDPAADDAYMLTLTQKIALLLALVVTLLAVAGIGGGWKWRQQAVGTGSQLAASSQVATS
jgi:hypothetical protein